MSKRATAPHNLIDDLLHPDFRPNIVDQNEICLMQVANFAYRNDPEMYDELSSHLRDCYTCMEHGFGICSVSQEMKDKLPIQGIPSLDFDAGFMTFMLTIQLYRAGVSPEKAKDLMPDIAEDIIKRYREYNEKNNAHRSKYLRRLNRKAFWQGFLSGLALKRTPAKVSYTEDEEYALGLSSLIILIQATKDEIHGRTRPQ